MSDNFYFFWVVTHTLVISIGFSIGLTVGLKLPKIGDAIAMLVVGGLLMVSQYYLLKNELSITQNWITYSFVGLILGVAGSFVFILLTSDSFGMADSHIYSFPISLIVLTTFQAFLLKDKFSLILIWPVISVIAFLISAIVLFAINTQWNLAFDLLGDRRQELDKIPIWGVTGAVIGIIYGLITGYALKG